MSVPELIIPPEFEDGQVLSRALYRLLFDNDKFLNGWADRRIPVPAAVYGDYAGSPGERTIYDGWILKDAEHTLLHYGIEVSSYAEDHGTVTLYWNSSSIASVHNTETEYDTYDASGKADGLARIRAILTQSDPENYPADGVCVAPYLAYTGALSYTAPPAIADEATSSKDEFNTWRDNDLYFREMLGDNAGCLSVARGWIGDEPNLIIWDGNIEYMAGHNRIYYNVQLFDTSDDTTLEGYFDYGGVGEHNFASISDTDEHESYGTLPGGYVEGTRYRVVWRLERTV